nr:carboxypeptidase-like regulatory domain-containing protein [Bacteroidales bacterium]
MRKLILLFFVFTTIATITIAQTGSVRGFVYDKATGETIIFSNVLILNTTHGSSTDNNGYFAIPKVPKGDYNIRVTFMGYEEKVIPIKVVANEITTLKIELEPSSRLLNAVEIRADRLAAKTESQV